MKKIKLTKEELLKRLLDGDNNGALYYYDSSEDYPFRVTENKKDIR